MNSISALLLDFDGTIIDSELTFYHAWRDVFAAHGQQLDIPTWNHLGWQNRTSQNAHELLSSLCGRELDLEALRDQVRKRERELVADVPLQPGIKELLDYCKLKGIRPAVISSSSSEWVGSHLRRLGIADRFGVLVTKESVTRHKPDPEPYLHALELLACRKEEAVAVEDSAVGVAAAKGAGIFTIAVPNAITAGLDLSAADAIAGSGAQVVSLLANPEGHKSMRMMRTRG